MSSYRYETENERLDIKPSVVEKDVFLWVHDGCKEAAITFPKIDAPNVALELLKAAGWPEDTPNSVTHQILDNLRRVVEIAEQVGREVKLTERRDALSWEFNPDQLSQLPYKSRTISLRKAIDRIIELEDGASRD